MTVSKGMIFSYNAENRLVEASPQNPQQGSVKATYIYDYMGRRARKSVYTYASGSWQKQKDQSFIYDGWNMVKESEKTSDSSPEVSAYYVWGLDLSQSMQGAGGVGGLIASVKAGNEYLYSYDANGNVGQMVKASDGSIAAHYEYDPFGKTIFAEGAMAAENPYRFSTKYLDDETGLYYYGFRFYNVELGRWINRDPMDEKGGINLYLFTYNNGINYFDPLGLKTIPELSGELKEEASNLSHKFSIAQRNALANGDLLGYLFYSLDTIAYGVASILLPQNDEEFFVAMITADAAPVIINSVKYLISGGKAAYFKVFKKCGDDLVEVSDDIAREVEEKIVAKIGGRRGNQATRDHLDRVRDEFLDQNPEYRHVAGGRDRVTGEEIPEEYLPGLNGGRQGSSYPDLTFEAPDGTRIRINTVDTLSDGTMTPREQNNFDRIFEQTGEPIVAIPKQTAE